MTLFIKMISIVPSEKKMKQQVLSMKMEREWSRILNLMVSFIQIGVQ